MQTLSDTLLFPRRTLIGNGRVRDLLPECAQIGARGVFVYGKSLTASGKVKEILLNKPQSLNVLEWEHPGGEPSLNQLRALTKAAHELGADWIAAVGGGSVLDLAKACAGLFNAGNDPAFYFDGNPVERHGISFVGVPTTAGTGAEATPNAVLINTDTQLKRSIRDDSFMAELVVLDAELLKTCPRNVIAWSGMDAFTQALEVFVSNRASWMSDQFGLKALTLIAKCLPVVYSNPSAPEAEGLLFGSYLSGLGLSIARLGIVHGMAQALGIVYNQPHGLVCAVSLPNAIKLNRSEMGAKYEQMSTAVGADILDFVENLNRRLGIVSPFKGKPIRNRETIISETLASGSTATNPKKISEADIDWLLEQLFKS